MNSDKKNKLNILIVVPKFANKGDFYQFPLGLAYISSSLKSKGFNIFCLNLCHYDENIISTKEIIYKYIDDNNIKIVCTGGMSGHWNVIDNILNLVKKYDNKIITIVGGPIITSNPQLAINNMKIDYGVLKEGEITITELANALCNNLNPKTVKGVIFKINNNITLTEERPPIEDLDSLPFPDYEGLEYDKWLPLMKYSGFFPVLEDFEKVNYAPIIGSRSCPFGCTFCYHPLGKKYRQRSLDNIFAEIDYLVNKYDINFISFQDELFSINHERMYAFADRIKKYKIRWDGQFRVNDVNEKMLLKLKDSGIIYMTYGIESINDEILKSMKKMITKDEIEKALKLTHDANMFCSGNLIIGDPKETKETIKNTISWWMKNKKYNVSLTFLLTIPNSPIYQYAIANNLIKDEINHIKKHFPVINLTKINDKDFAKILKTISLYRKKMLNILDGQFINSKKISEKFKNKYFYETEIRCPHCNNTSTYKRFLKSADDYLAFNCKKCFSKFKIKQSKIFYEDYKPFNWFFEKRLKNIVFFLHRYEFIKNPPPVLLKIKLIIKKYF